MDVVPTIVFSGDNSAHIRKGETLMSALPTHIFHLAELANWESIQRHGLLPACRLIELSGYERQEGELLCRTHRATHTVLKNGVHIRDQGPMPPQALATCLVSLTPAEWYAEINARVFFWLDAGRLNRQRAACEPRPQMVLTVDTASLIEHYAPLIAVSPINSGFARRKPARRGLASFVAYEEWRTAGWTSEAVALGMPPRKRSHLPAELTIRGSLPDVMRYVVSHRRLEAGEAF